MKGISSTIQKGKFFEEVLMTSANSSKKIITELTNHLKQLAQKNGLASLSASQLSSQHSIFVMLPSPFLQQNMFSNYKSKSIQYQSVINPKILDYSVNQLFVWQQCSSYPNIKFLMKRSTHVITEYQSSYKERAASKIQLKGFQSIVFQHQYSHIKCKNLFDFCEQVDLIQNEHFSESKRQKLRQQFKKFKSQRQQITDLIVKNKQKAKQGDQKGQVYEYKKCKSLRSFVQYEIIDPV